MINYIHFGLTSQDINRLNILMIKQSISHFYLNEILGKVKKSMLEWSKIPLLAKLCGQPDSLFLLVKNCLYFTRLVIQARKLNSINYTTKFGGANGNFNAHHMALPNIDWIEFANKFVQIFGLERNQYTTQIDHYDNYAEVFDCIRRINVILVYMCQDIWLYISRNILVQNVNKKEVGSSTMPHKINPINFENAEGNLLMANSMLEFFSRKLPVSRMQRDLTDSTILRNVGTAFSHTMIAFTSLLQGLNKLEINEEVMRKELEDNLVLYLKEYRLNEGLGIEGDCEKMKEITRKNSDSKRELLKFAEQSDFTQRRKIFEDYNSIQLHWYL